MGQRVADTVRRNVKVLEKLLVSAPASVGGLAVGQRQEFFDLLEIQGEQESSVEKDPPALAALGVSGELPAVNHQVRVAGSLNRPVKKGAQGFRVALKDGLVTAGDGSKRNAGIRLEQQGEIQAARSLEHGSSAAAAPEDGDVELPAPLGLDIGRKRPGVAENDEKTGRLPKAEDFVAAVGLQMVQECLIAGEIFLGRGESKIQLFHGVMECKPII